MKFLHIADIHLGKKLYRSEERTLDFFYALQDVIRKYAIQENVDFVIMAGDWFDVRKIESSAMNQAIAVLKELQQANIPMIAIEGNHDSNEAFSEFSWMRSLSSWGYFNLLEPVFSEGGDITLVPWNDNTRKGSYIDIGKARIVGTVWTGSSTEQVLTKLLPELKKTYDPKKFNILMLHTDVEGQLSKHIKGLPVDKLRELKGVVDYLALGHTHKNFEIDKWGYNPGSLEACTVDEYANIRGAYLVEVKGKKHKATLVRDYRQREIIRSSFDITGIENAEDFHSKLSEFLKNNVKPKDSSLEPIIELTIIGQSDIKTSALNIEKIKLKLKSEFKCLVAIVKNQSTPTGYNIDVTPNRDRRSIEKNAVQELLKKDPNFKARADKFSDVILEIKGMALAKDDPELIISVIEKGLKD